MMRSPRRADEAPEGPFRGPERLALAMPLTAALGLIVVMAAASLGQSTLIVTLAAVGGFALCAFAPMALLQVYVGRPLRAALAHLRAAHDGAEPPTALPAPGVIADLVAVARDIQGAQANIGQYRAGVALCEKMAAAGDEAIRAFRLQCEELAETSVQGESQLRRSAQGQFAEIAEALKAFKAAASSTALDSGMERIEQMLVYLADMLERREKPSEGGDRIDGALTDIVRLIGREAQAIRETVATAALTARNDITSVGADDKAAHSRQQERLETLEARLLTRLADAAAPDSSRLVDVIRTEAETTRRVLRDRPEPAPADEALPSLRGAMEEAVVRLDAAVETMKAERNARAPDLQALAEAVARIGEAAAPAGAEGETLRAEVRHAAAGLGGAIAGLADVAERLREQGQLQSGRFDEIEARLLKVMGDSQAAALAVLAKCTDKLRNALDRFDVLSTAAASAASGQSDDLRAAVRALEGEVAAFGGRLAQGVEALDFPALREDFAALGARVGEALEGVASRVEASGKAQAERLGAFETGPLEAARGALAGAMSAFGEAHGQTFDALRADVAGVAPRVEELCNGLARRLDTLDAKSFQPATRDLAAAQARAESFARQIAISAAALSALAERESRDFDGLRAAFDGAETAVAGAATAMQAQASLWDERLGAWGAGTLATLDETTRSLTETGAALVRAGEGIETVALQAQNAHARLGETLGPLDALAPAITALHVLTQALEASAGQVSRGVEGLNAVASAERPEWPALRESVAEVQSSLAALAARDFEGLNAATDEAAKVAALWDEKLAPLGETARRLADTQAALESVGVRIEAGAQGFGSERGEWAALRETFARDAQSLPVAIESLKALAEAERPQGPALREDISTAFAQMRERAEAAEKAQAEQAAVLEARIADLAARDDETQALRAAADELIALGARLGGDLTEGVANDVGDRLGTRLAEDAAALKDGGRATLNALAQEIARLGAAPAADFIALSQDIDDRFDVFARRQAERAEALEMRVAARASTLDRTAVASPLTVLRALTSQLAGTFERVQIAGRSASLDRTAVAPALIAFRGRGRALKDAVGRFEAATRTVEARTLALAPPDAQEAQDWRGDLGMLADEPAEIGGLVETLRAEWRALGETLAANAAQGEGSPWRADLDALGGRLSETLVDVERRLSAVARPYPELAWPVDPKSSGALAKIVMSLADSLDFRFVQIEHGAGATGAYPDRRPPAARRDGQADGVVKV